MTRDSAGRFRLRPIEELELHFPIVCPFKSCAAPIGKPCRTLTGLVTFTHEQRHSRAREQNVYCTNLTSKQVRELRERAQDGGAQ